MNHHCIRLLPSNRTLGLRMLIASGVCRRTTPFNFTELASCSVPLKTMKRVSGTISSQGLLLREPAW